ncbi:unnamed protein product [Sphagnum balticum]
MDGYRWMQKGGGNNNSGEETRLRESDIDQVNENWTKWMKAAGGGGSAVEKAMLVFPSARGVSGVMDGWMGTKRRRQQQWGKRQETPRE